MSWSPANNAKRQLSTTDAGILYILSYQEKATLGRRMKRVWKQQKQRNRCERGKKWSTRDRAIVALWPVRCELVGTLDTVRDEENWRIEKEEKKNKQELATVLRTSWIWSTADNVPAGSQYGVLSVAYWGWWWWRPAWRPTACFPAVVPFLIILLGDWHEALNSFLLI